MLMRVMNELTKAKAYIVHGPASGIKYFAKIISGF